MVIKRWGGGGGALREKRLDNSLTHICFVLFFIVRNDVTHTAFGR